LRDEIPGGWGKLHNREIHNLYSSPNIIRMIKSMRTGWTGHVAHVGMERNAYRIENNRLFLKYLHLPIRLHGVMLN
jgi:hypothetical protein